MTPDEMVALVHRFYADAPVGAEDDVLLAPDFVYHGPPMLGGTSDREGFKRVLAGLRAAFPGFETDVEDVIVQGDKAAVRHTHHATQTGEFNGLPPTGRRVTVPGIEILRMRDGQIVEFWHLDDFLGLLQQLGAIPGPAA